MDEKMVDINRTVYELTADYPELVGILKDLGFAPISNPIARQTLGRQMTLRKGCEMRKVPMEAVKAKLESAGFNVTE